MRRAAPRLWAREGRPLYPTCAALGGRGCGSCGKGGLCLTDSPVETAGVWGAGQERCGQAAFPTTAPPPSRYPNSPAIGALGLEEGAPESFKVIVLSSRDPGFPDSFSYLPRNLILREGGGAQVPKDFVLSRPPSKLLGAPEGGASAGWDTRLDPLILSSP